MTIGHALQSLKPEQNGFFMVMITLVLLGLDSVRQQPTKQKLFDKIAELDSAEAMRLLRIERDKKNCRDRLESIIRSNTI